MLKVGFALYLCWSNPLFTKIREVPKPGSTPAASTSLRSERSDKAKAAAPKQRPTLRRRAEAVAALRATARQASLNFYYVYILQSADGRRFYVGLTQNLTERLRKHNAGEVPHTAKFKPRFIKTAIAFRDRDRGASLERYECRAAQLTTPQP